jgi:hypothetical protein
VKGGRFSSADSGKGPWDAPLGSLSELFRLGLDGRRKAGCAREVATPTRGYGSTTARAF